MKFPFKLVLLPSHGLCRKKRERREEKRNCFAMLLGRFLLPFLPSSILHVYGNPSPSSLSLSFSLPSLPTFLQQLISGRPKGRKEGGKEQGKRDAGLFTSLSLSLAPPFLLGLPRTQEEALHYAIICIANPPRFFPSCMRERLSCRKGGLKLLLPSPHS